MTRPIFAVEDDELVAQVAPQVAVWDSGFSSYADLDGLLDALKVTPLRAEQFGPVVLDSRGVVSGEDLRRRFAHAVEHLRDELMRGDQPLHDSLAVRWSSLCTAQVIVEGELELAADAAGKRVVVEAGAHVRRD